MEILINAFDQKSNIIIQTAPKMEGPHKLDKEIILAGVFSYMDYYQ